MKLSTAVQCIISAETILFWKWKMWKFSYSFNIVAISYFINWIVASETIEGGKYSREETIYRNSGSKKTLSYLHYCPQLYCNFRSSEATLNSTSGSLGRSSFEVTESIEAGDTTLHTNSTNGGLLRSQVRFQQLLGTRNQALRAWF